MAGPAGATTHRHMAKAEGGHVLHGFANGRLVSVQAMNAPRAFNASVQRMGVPKPMS